MRVAILGSGPAGLIAADAAATAYCEVTIISRTRKATLDGSEVLRFSCLPWWSDQRAYVRPMLSLRGTSNLNYLGRVYGSELEILDDKLALVRDMQAEYDELYRKYQFLISEHEFDPEHGYGGVEEDFDVVFSTLPSEQFCEAGHQFKAEEAWFTSSALSVEIPLLVLPDTITYNAANDGPSWMRTSNLFGISTLEWDGDRQQPPFTVTKVIKPISTSCTCHPKIIRIGKYAEWSNQTLLHEAYYKVRNHLRSMQTTQ